MYRSRTAVAALLLVAPLTLTACSGEEGDVDVNAPNVEVTPGDADVDAPEVDAPEVDAPDVDADADVDVDTENPEDADGEAGDDESPAG